MIAYWKPATRSALVFSAVTFGLLCCLTFTRAATKDAQDDITATPKQVAPGKPVQQEPQRVEKGQRTPEDLKAEAGKSIRDDLTRAKLLTLADMAEKKGQFPDALKSLTEYLERFPDDPVAPEIMLKQARLLRQMGKFDEALSTLYLTGKEVLNLRRPPLNLEYMMRLTLTAQSEIAETYYLQGKFTNAAAHFQGLLRGHAKELLNEPVIRTKLIRSLAKSGDNAAVVKNATAFLHDYPEAANQLEVRTLLAAAYENLGQKEEASRALTAPAGSSPVRVVTAQEVEKRSIARETGSSPVSVVTAQEEVIVKRNTRIPVPLTRKLIGYEASGSNKKSDSDRIVELDVNGEVLAVAQPDKIVVNIRSAGQHFAVARISLLSDGDNFIRQMNLHRERLLDIAVGTLGGKTLVEIETLGFRRLLKLDLQTQFNQILGANVVKEIIITDFVVQ